MLPEKRERCRRGERYVEAGGDGALRRAVGVVFLPGRRRRRRGVDPFDREDLPVAAVLADRTREVARLAGLTSYLDVRPLDRDLEFRGPSEVAFLERVFVVSARWIAIIFATSSPARRRKRR